MSEGMLGGITLASVAGLINDLLEKLTSKEGEKWLSAFKRFLRKENPWPQFPTWRTIKLGTHKSVKSLVEAIEAKGFKIGDWARNIAKNVTLAEKMTEVELVVVTGHDVGLEGNYTTIQMFTAAAAHGLSKCPAEVGLQLRLQYDDQPNNEWLLIAMEPIADSDCGLNVFNVAHIGFGCWLRTNYGHPGNVCFTDDRWVFLRSKQ